MAPPETKKKKTPCSSTASRAASHRSASSVSQHKIEILINVYDLLPPGSLSNTLWFLGSSLLHTGVIIRSLEREYAFGGHDRPKLSGIYWTTPRTLPPGGTFRCQLLQGFTFRGEQEIEQIIKEASGKFLGTSYNLLTNNCNHFTSYLCEKLVGKAAPSWINRAAGIGIALPCVVPREWIAPPDHDTMEGELLDDSGLDEDERTSMLRMDYQRARDSFHGSHAGSHTGIEFEDDGWDSDRDRRRGGTGKGKGKGKIVLRDTEGRVLPPTERAPGA